MPSGSCEVARRYGKELNINKMYYYLVKVKEYSNDCIDFIIKADSKKKAIDIAYKEVVRIYPPDYMRSRLYEPYHKKDISVFRIDKLLFNEDGLTDIYMG